MNAPQKLKTRKCNICKTPFLQFRTTQKVCSPKCAAEAARLKREKEERLEAKRQRQQTREAKDKAKTLTERKDDLKFWFNKFIRLRDRDEPCISCGTRNPNIVYAAGHYRTTKAASHLRFNEDNVHKQCNEYCNRQQSGNITNYRINLIKKIGVERVEALENDNRTYRYTHEELKQLIATYKAKCKELLTREGD
jgi:hypothetical protein